MASEKLLRQGSGQKKNLQNLDLHIWIPGLTLYLQSTRNTTKELFEALKAHDIYVRFWGSERIEQYMRITIGTREEMEQLFAFLKEYMWRGSEQLQK